AGSFTKEVCHACIARKACAVKSLPLRSHCSLPEPRQNVGQPPSTFCISRSQLTPNAAAAKILVCCCAGNSHLDQAAKALSAEDVSSTPGRPPAPAVQAQPPGSASRSDCDCPCWHNNTQSRQPNSCTSSPAAAKELTA